MLRRLVIAALGVVAATGVAVATRAIQARRRFESGERALEPAGTGIPVADITGTTPTSGRVATKTGPGGSPPQEAPRPIRRRRSDDDGVLRGLADIRAFFRTNETPVYFISATAFNLLGIDRWVRNFRFISYYDTFEGGHPSVFVPREREPRAFGSIEEINDYLLGHKEVRDYITARRPPGAPDAGLATFLMFEESTERLAEEAGLRVAFPSAALRHRLDSKVETTRLGNEAGVPSVPNVLGRARSYRALRALADEADLGTELVVQTPYGDSGKTTFFISTEQDWKEHAAELRGQDLKVMRRIDPRELAIEGVVTRHGTLVGPLMTELAGFPELTPYGGGWCGDEVFGLPIGGGLEDVARERTRAMGERLRQEGYRGYFELDFLLDAGTGDLWLGELNPRVTGASSITNVSAAAYGDMPLFLFHLLEFMGVEYELDVDALNARWAGLGERMDSWAQVVIKDVGDEVALLTQAPRSGIWRLGADGAVSFSRPATDWHRVEDESEAFYLRIAGPGGYRYHGADLGILVSRGRFMTDDYELTDRTRAWIRGLEAHFAQVPVDEGEPPPVPHPDPFGFKLL
jgi:hypothetical protein